MLCLLPHKHSLLREEDVLSIGGQPEVQTYENITAAFIVLMKRCSELLIFEYLQRIADKLYSLSTSEYSDSAESFWLVLMCGWTAIVSTCGSTDKNLNR